MDQSKAKTVIGVSCAVAWAGAARDAAVDGQIAVGPAAARVLGRGSGKQTDRIDRRLGKLGCGKAVPGVEIVYSPFPGVAVHVVEAHKARSLSADLMGSV